MTRETDNRNQHDAAGEHRPVSRGACSSVGPSRPSPSCSEWPAPTTGRRPRSAGRSRASTRHRRRGCPAAAGGRRSSRSTTRSGPTASRSPPAPRSCGPTPGTTITTSRPPTALGVRQGVVPSRVDDSATCSPSPARYPYYCTIHGTAHAGMIGTIVVTGCSPRRVSGPGLSGEVNLDVETLSITEAAVRASRFSRPA